jgi:diguanylate cyclase (GGDEF)-like protein
VGQDYTRRELLAGALIGAGFLVAAIVLWVAGGTPAPGMTGLCFTLLCVLLSAVTFHVGSAYCSPLMLAVVPMLLLVPAPVVPLLIAAAQFSLRLFRGPRDARLALTLTDSAASFAPALLMTLVAVPDSLVLQALLIGACFVVWALNDLALWPLLMRVERDDLRTAAWIYGVDALLVPIGFAIALATREVPAAVIAILPLAGLLAFFARERRLRAEQEQTLHTILQHASDLILIAGRDGRLRSVLGASAHLLGDDRAGGTLLDLVHPDDVGTVGRFLASAPGAAEFRLRHDARHVYAVAADLTQDPHVRGLVVTIRDDEARQDLRRRASHDPRSGLANRLLLYERIAAADTDVALLYLDLDGFKPINDRFGHAAGDEVLRLVARRLEHCVRAEDTVARLGGDEFALLVSHASDDVAERVRAAFDSPFTVDGQELAVGASVGVATGAGDPDALLAAADRAMYAVKHRR